MPELQPLPVHDVARITRTLATFRITDTTTTAEAIDAIRPLAQFNGSTLGMVRFRGLTPWEIHTDDEFLLITDGAIDITILLPEGGALQGRAASGEVLVVPAGHWHRQHAPEGGTVLFITGPQGDVSTLADPRQP